MGRLPRSCPMRGALILLLLVLLAGCAAPEVPRAADVPTEGDAPAPTLKAANATAEAPGVPTEVALSWDGNTGSYVCLPDGPGSCRGRELAAPDAVHLPEVTGNVTAAALTATWTPATPTTLELGALAGAFVACGDGCWQWTTLAEVRGVSPLALDVSEVDLGEGEQLGFLVFAPCLVATPPAFACADVDQPFHAEASLTVLG